MDQIQGLVTCAAGMPMGMPELPSSFGSSKYGSHCAFRRVCYRRRYSRHENMAAIGNVNVTKEIVEDRLCRVSSASGNFCAKFNGLGQIDGGGNSSALGCCWFRHEGKKHCDSKLCSKGIWNSAEDRTRQILARSVNESCSALTTFDSSLTPEVLKNSQNSVPTRALPQSPVLPAENGDVGNPGISTHTGTLTDTFRVVGGNALSGHVQISGAKNSALAVLAGALCSTDQICLRMLPDLVDVRGMFQVLQSVGVHIQRRHETVIIDPRNLVSEEPCTDAVKKLRGSFLIIGSLVARLGEAVVPFPGGCNIGARPVDLHIRGLEALGAKVHVRQDKVHVRARNGRRLMGGNFFLDYPSVGATETLMMAACLADGHSILSNVAQVQACISLETMELCEEQEPEVVDLARFLICCGASIHGAGTRTLIIKGVKKLHGTDFTVIPDRIEAGTYLIAAAMTRSTISMSPIIPHHLASVISKLRSMGCKIQQPAVDVLQISCPQCLQSSSVMSRPYPGFPTDLQPQIMSLLTTCSGKGVVEETIFESRMSHVDELIKLGAQIEVNMNQATIRGLDNGSFLCGAHVTTNDLRAGAALVLAALVSVGVTHIKGINHIDRGYERMDEKLCLLGASIERFP